MAPKFRKLALFIICCWIVAWSGSALAAGLNITSQFGYGNVWAYRQSTPCNKSSSSANPSSACPTGACGSGACSRGACPSTNCRQGACKSNGCASCSRSCGQTNGSVPSTPAPTNPPTTDGHYTIGSSSAQELEAWNYVNKDRANEGLPALTLDPELCRLARMKSQDMLANNYFAHTSPTLGNAAAMLRNNGYSFSAVGENISRHATVLKSHAALMSSDGHRRNILGSNWTRIGIGIALDQNGYVYMTQLFVR